MRIVLLSVLAGILLVPASAMAKRPPSAGEAAAIRSAVRGFVAMPNSPAAKDNRVVSIAISSADPRYAAVRLNSKSAGPSVMVLHRSRGTWWELEFGSSLGCDTAPKAVMTDLGVGCSPPDGVAWIDTCGPLVSEPTSLIVACADANFQLVRLHWRGWGHDTTTATGAAYANDCKPYCAAGHFHTYPATMTATELRPCGKARYYARLTIAYASKRPAGLPRRQVLRLGC